MAGETALCAAGHTYVRGGHGCRVCDREWKRRPEQKQADRERRQSAEYRARSAARKTSAKYQAWARDYANRPERKAYRKKLKALRRMKVQVAAEEFTAEEIADRDGWRCGICCLEIPREAKFPHPLSVTLDHIEPLSLGGNHTRANVRIAHFRCNTRRGNRVA